MRIFVVPPFLLQPQSLKDFPQFNLQNLLISHSMSVLLGLLDDTIPFVDSYYQNADNPMQSLLNTETPLSLMGIGDGCIMIIAEFCTARSFIWLSLINTRLHSIISKLQNMQKHRMLCIKQFNVTNKPSYMNWEEFHNELKSFAMTCNVPRH